MVERVGINMKDEVKGLLIQARAGDEEAFSQIFTLYRNSVFVKARRIMQNDANAQDIVQETFLIVHRNLYQLRDLDLFYSWLMQITVSRCQMHFRKEKHYTNVEYDDTLLGQKETRSYLDPVKHVDQMNEREILLKMIDSLAPKKAIVVKMAYLEEMRMDEIAAVLGINVNTVKTRAKRGREDLQKMIEAYEEKEHVKLHVDVLLPAALLTSAMHPSIITWVLQKSTQTLQYIKQNLLISSCVTSLGALAVTGTVFVVQDYQAQANIEQKEAVSANVETSQAEDKKEDTNTNPPAVIQKKTKVLFVPVTYEEEELTSAREAYYVCLNFAQKQAEFEQMSNEELRALKPVFDALKTSNSPYYQLLEDTGWAGLYTNAIQNITH